MDLPFGSLFSGGGGLDLGLERAAKLDILYEGFSKIYLNVSTQSLRNATRGKNKKKKPRKEQVEVLLVNKRPEGLFE